MLRKRVALWWTDASQKAHQQSLWVCSVLPRSCWASKVEAWINMFLVDMLFPARGCTVCLFVRHVSGISDWHSLASGRLTRWVGSRVASLSVCDVSNTRRSRLSLSPHRTQWWSAKGKKKTCERSAVCQYACRCASERSFTFSSLYFCVQRAIISPCCLSVHLSSASLLLDSCSLMFSPFMLSKPPCLILHVHLYNFLLFPVLECAPRISPWLFLHLF